VRGERQVFASLLVAVCCLTAASAPAHRAKTGLTTIEQNPRSGRVEIVHSLHWHDAELGLGGVGGNPQISLMTVEARARLALYVEERFAIADAKTASPLTLELVGAELSGDYVLVYQELAEALPDAIAVRHDVLRDVFPEQVNQVNLFLGDDVRTLVFAGDDGWKSTVLRQ
jgi:hypothetical protein